MVCRLENGDMAVDVRGNLIQVDEVSEILEQVKFCLQVNKGCFKFNPDLGFNYNERITENNAYYLVSEAVANITQVEVVEVVLNNQKLDIKLLINKNNIRRITI